MFRWEADLTSFPVVHYLVVNQVLEKTLRLKSVSGILAVSEGPT